MLELGPAAVGAAVFAGHMASDPFVARRGPMVPSDSSSTHVLVDAASSDQYGPLRSVPATPGRGETTKHARQRRAGWDPTRRRISYEEMK